MQSITRKKKYEVEVRKDDRRTIDADGCMCSDTGQLVFVIERPCVATPANGNATAETVPLVVFKEWISFTDLSVKQSLKV